LTSERLLLLAFPFEQLFLALPDSGSAEQFRYPVWCNGHVPFATSFDKVQLHQALQMFPRGAGVDGELFGDLGRGSAVGAAPPRHRCAFADSSPPSPVFT
jgi:hypothetical protein